MASSRRRWPRGARVMAVSAAVATLGFLRKLQHGQLGQATRWTAFTETPVLSRGSTPAGIGPEDESGAEGSEDWWASGFEHDMREVSPLEYQLHAGAGALRSGELHLNAAGLISPGKLTAPEDWRLGYQKRVPSLASKLRGWQPSFRSHIAKKSYGASMQWSKAMLQDGEQTQPDGTGLDINIETSMQAPRDSKAEKEWEQRAEVVLGPRAQAKYLNFSLPVGLKLGAVVSSKPTQQDEQNGAEEGASRVPRIYADISWPGLNELQGWLLEAQTLHRRVGAWTGQVRRDWQIKNRPKPETDWSLQHFQQYRPFRLPAIVGDGMASASAFIQDSFGHLWDGYHRIPQPTPRPAVIPATKLRIGSNGPGALLGLQSAQSGLGGSGFDGVVEVSKLGWGAKLALALGVADEGLGQPRYAITASGAWHNKTSILHELKWMLSDGQWAGVTFQNGGPGRPPRINAAVELVR
eukprot:Skav203311  [mRNA]  locus=scaffold1007:24918:26315:- [translate_table: standard]